MRHGGCIVDVLDLDSPVPNRFAEADRAGCERLVATLTDQKREAGVALQP